jgi:hypothetical protein
MGTELLTDRFADQIVGVLSCYDRARQIRIFDYPHFAQPLRDQLREHVEQLAVENDIAIEFIRKSGIRKSDKIQELIGKRGSHPGLVAILSAMEPCSTYKPWHDKPTGKTFLRPDDGKCLHYYFYFIDKQLGLCYLRVPTWCPFRLQFYCNGHFWLAAELSQRNIPYRLADNAFAAVGNFTEGQRIADGLQVKALHRKLEAFVRHYCPAIADLGVTYHWSIDQAEYSTDIIFRRQADFGAIYDRLTRTAIHTVKPENVATFLGRKLNGNYQDELGNRFDTRIEGTRIKHTMGPVSLKMYDKYGFILRIADDGQRRLVLQALPTGRTPRRHDADQMDLDEEGHLQLAGLTRGAVRRQSPLLGVHLNHRHPNGGDRRTSQNRCKPARRRAHLPRF